jgi:hypothetical protein
MTTTTAAPDRSRSGRAPRDVNGIVVRAGLLFMLSLVACQGDPTTGPSPDARAGDDNRATGAAAPTGGTASAASATACPACAFGPQLYTRATGQPVTHTATFSGDPAGAYIIEIDDLGTQGANATVELNGKGLDARSGYTRHAVSLQAANQLQTRLTGKPGSQLKVRIFQEVHSVTVTPNLTLTRMPATQQFTAVARDANGVVIPRQTFEWESSDLTIATIDGTTGVASTTGAVHNTVKWQYKTITTGEGTTQIVARAIESTVQGSVPWRISAGFVYTTFRAPLPLNSPNRAARPNPEPLRYDVARLRSMAARCNIENGNEQWFEYLVGTERLFFQCFASLELTTLRRIPLPFGLYAYDRVPNVGAYGRYCGDGHPSGNWYHEHANAGNYEPKDPSDALCMEHDAQELNHELSTSSLIESTLATCIVRYGFETETLHEDGVRIPRGSPRWDAFWAAWPQMAENRAHFFALTLAACPDGNLEVGGVTITGVYNTFLAARGL